MTVEAPVRERRGISIRAPLTGLVLVLLVVLGGYYGWQAAFAPVDPLAAGDDCATTSTATTTTTAPATSAPATTGDIASVAPAGVVTSVPTTASAPPAGFLQPGDVTVNVFNSTLTRGLANNTAALLRERGFEISEVGNDKLGAEILGVAQIRAARADMPEVRLLLQHVPGAEVLADGRESSTVDLVIGEAFASLADPATVTPVPIATPRC